MASLRGSLHAPSADRGFHSSTAPRSPCEGNAELGAANLHTLLGAARPRVTLSHFLTGEVQSLADVMVQTSVPNLWLVSGHQALLEMANPKQREKEQLSRQIQSLDVDDVLLDLGAGSAFNVLDLFLLAQRGL